MADPDVFPLRDEPLPPTITLRQEKRWGPAAWVGTASAARYHEERVYGWTEAHVEAKARRAIARRLARDRRRSETYRQITVCPDPGNCGCP